MKSIIVREEVYYRFEMPDDWVPPGDDAEMTEDDKLHAWFCDLENPIAEAEVSLVNRQFEVEES
jgi:hypothetical protein